MIVNFLTFINLLIFFTIFAPSKYQRGVLAD